MSEPTKVAVIDIGSNSIKLLVARRGTNCGRVKPAHESALNARISAGINRAEPRLSEEGMAVGLGAIETLLAEAAPQQPQAIQLVATSAVRDALNRDEFISRVQQATGHTIRTLTGTEEANYIGRGLLSDPALVDAQDYYVFDLGGGSLECLCFQQRSVTKAVSLPLGCVRLTERFVANREAPLAPDEIAALHHHVAATLQASGFAFHLPPHAPAIGTGGTLVSCRAILAARQGVPFAASSPRLAVEALAQLAREVGAMPLNARREIPGLPSARADVFPVAVQTVLALMGAGGFAALQHSFYNLRYGIADELLKLCANRG